MPFTEGTADTDVSSLRRMPADDLRWRPCLCDADIDFVVVGGFAALLHGSTQVTRDLDVCAVLGSEDVTKLREVLRDLKPTHRLMPQRLSFLANPDPGAPVRNPYLETELGAVDILSSILGVGDFERPHGIRGDRNLWAALAREKDLLAAKELRAIREKTQ